jgi:large subunit ribosomal protein L13
LYDSSSLPGPGTARVRPNPARPPENDAKAPMKTYSPKPREVQQDWYVVDATGKTLGRLATQIAQTITGKLKPQYAPHVDTGDYVIVLNCDKIRVTGNKLTQKIYYRHSGFPGGLKQRTLQEQLDRHPEEVIRKAVKGMVPRNRMGASQLKKLKIYQGGEHPHENFNPKPLPGFEN